jgi:rare lipoprotein A
MITSWYGNQFHGSQTASGEIFNMYDYTAAHRTLPFGTKLKLINENNNKEVVVRVNDRGPIPLERDLDISFKAAETLDFVGSGIVRLKVIFLD